ncbi:polysaccharide biosynthesis protein [Halobacillus rhizosphaerae]|uniref:putative polysaccharide biosynthesis protein n=1 Tax=Halobacillus rhizosphaerae TaxID=3064889 RepID=UPI00398A7F7B
MTNHHNSHSLVRGAVLLTLAGLFSKVLSAGYRIPLQNIAGDLGFYIYQQVYPILGMTLILSLYGFPVAISKLVSEIKEQNQSLSFSSFYIPAFTWLMGICFVIFILGYTEAKRIAAVMGDVKLVSSLKAAFFVFLFLPFTSLFRGVYQGLNNMQPTAVTQVAEQLVRVSVIILTAVYVVKGGSIYHLGIGAAAGSILGSLVSILILGYFLRKDQIWTKARWESFSVSYLKTILFYGLFICFNYMLLLMLQLVDSLTLVPHLIESGMEQEAAKIYKGIFDRGQPLIQLGTVLASSIALALIPSVTRKKLKEKQTEVHGYIFAAVKFSFLLALGAAVGLIVLFPEINQLFFQDSEGTSALRLFMVIILFSSLAITTSSVLQGLGRVTHTALLVAAGVVIKWGANLLLIPIYQLHGAALASILAAAVVMTGNLILLNKDFHVIKWLDLPWFSAVVSIGGMGISLIAMKEILPVSVFLDHRFSLLVYTLAMTGIGALIYLLILLRLGALSNRELEALPKGRWLIRLLPKGMRE